MRAATVFSGIGGADLGLQQSGFEIIWQCERDQWRRDVLAQRFPHVQCFWEAETLHEIVGTEPLDLLFADPPDRDPASLAPLWPIIARVRPTWVVMQATTLGASLLAAEMPRLGYSGCGFVMHQSSIRLGLEMHRHHPIAVAWKEEVRPDVAMVCSEAEDSMVEPAIQTPPRTIVEVVEYLQGLPPGWSCLCGATNPQACCESSTRLVAVNQATPPDLTRVIGVRLVSGLHRVVRVAVA